MKGILRVEGNQLLTDQWVLNIHGEFKLRKDYEPKLIECKDCGGHGGWSTGHFGTGDKEDCIMCNGTGKRYAYDHITEDRPEMPVERWHDGEGSNQDMTLMDYLDMTVDQFASWVAGPKVFMKKWGMYYRLPDRGQDRDNREDEDASQSF